MFDHVVSGASDYAASKAFFLKALEPIGMTIVSEGSLGIELSADGKSSLCLFQTAEKPAHLHLAFVAENRHRSRHSIARRWKRAPRTTVRPACARTTAGDITRLSSSGRTDTTSKSSATSPRIDDAFFRNRNMKVEYWLQRWREGRTGWHHESVMPLLEQHWASLGVARGTRVLVPLCGKSLDMLWLAQQGTRVLGVEISPVAVEAFLAENHLHASKSEATDGVHCRITNAPANGDIEIIQGDVFGVAPGLLEDCGAFYDRAALIAFPAPMRDRLANEVYLKLPVGSRGLLITLEYPAGEMEGPPFSVDEAEVHRLLDAQWEIRQLERRDILASQPSFLEGGVTALHTAVYALTRRG